MNDGPCDARWIEQLVVRYERPLMSYAAHLLDRDRAGDVVQETFCRLCRARRSEVESRLPAWLYRVCRNLATDVLRKERRMKPLAALPEGSSQSASPPALAEQREDADRLAGALLALPDRQQELVRLKFQHGLSYKQIAEVSGLSVSNVGFILHTALKHLKNELALGQERVQ